MGKELLSALAIALTFIAFFPYIRSILKGKTRPHVFSWAIWDNQRVRGHSGLHKNH